MVHIGKAVGNSDVWFRFNEGVSNAVRRNVYIRELLLSDMGEKVDEAHVNLPP